MRYSSYRISITTAILGVALLGASQGSAVAAQTQPTAVPTAVPAAAPAPAPASADGAVSLDNTGSPENGLTPSALCIFYTRGDYVHVSSTAFEASGHGWWINGDCSATWAVVTVTLQEYYSDGSWRDKGTGQATVRSGGGSGNRATGRAGCNDATVTGWRSVVDVDLVGLIDDPGKLITSAQNISCRRY